MSEHLIQKAIVDYLELALPSSVRVVAVANKPRSAMQGRMEKQRGAKKGFPDLLLTGRFHGLIEVKKEGGYLAPEQKAWRDWCAEQQVPYAVVRSVYDVKETLVGWGLLRGVA